MLEDESVVFGEIFDAYQLLDGSVFCDLLEFHVSKDPADGTIHMLNADDSIDGSTTGSHETPCACGVLNPETQTVPELFNLRDLWAPCLTGAPVLSPVVEEVKVFSDLLHLFKEVRVFEDISIEEIKSFEELLTFTVSFLKLSFITGAYYHFEPHPISCEPSGLSSTVRQLSSAFTTGFLEESLKHLRLPAATPNADETAIFTLLPSYSAPARVLNQLIAFSFHTKKIMPRLEFEALLDAACDSFIFELLMASKFVGVVKDYSEGFLSLGVILLLSNAEFKKFALLNFSSPEALQHGPSNLSQEQLQLVRMLLHSKSDPETGAFPDVTSAIYDGIEPAMLSFDALETN